MSSLFVDEPFDFKGPYGGRVLNGKILSWIDPKHLLFEAEEELTRDGITSNFWLLSARYTKQTIDSKAFHGVVNGSLLSKVPDGNESIQELETCSKFGIIGRLEI